MIIHAKVGTHPSDRLEVQEDGPFSVGDKIHVRSKADNRILTWTQCRIDKIDNRPDEDFYFLSL